MIWIALVIVTLVLLVIINNVYQRQLDYENYVNDNLENIYDMLIVALKPVNDTDTDETTEENQRKTRVVILECSLIKKAKNG